MTRPKVDPDKRQRTACACDSCKRRKQKCNGLKPCNTCIKRHLACVYTPAPVASEPSQDTIGSPTKRRHVETSPTAMVTDAAGPKARPRQTQTQTQTQTHIPAFTPWYGSEASAMSQTRNGSSCPDTPDRPRESATRNWPHDSTDPDLRSRNSTTSGAAEEAEDYSLQRMLQDFTGRLLYVGDSATLSYLQLIRMLVESVAGQSEFTLDPKRHMIVEARTYPPPSNTPSGVLPDRRTADVLVESYYLNTTGFVEVFDRKTFHGQVEQCYSDPLTAEPPVLCQLNLVFAIGLVLARPVPGSEAEGLIAKLRMNKGVDRAEIFYRNAKCLADPMSGFEDADFWSVQALLLMALYMLSVSKRNAAYAYYGMAVRSAFALGLHREDSAYIFSKIESKVRRNLWRTLYVIDRFLSAALGRPTAISDEDCSDGALEAPETSFESEAERISSSALDAAVRSCRIIGDILKRVYSERKISIAIAQEIARKLGSWNGALSPALHWRQSRDHPITPSCGIATVHTNLLQCHSIMLLTRPFFLYILKAGITHEPNHVGQRMDAFAQACVEAAQHSLVIAQAAMDARYLSRCNPFVIHFVFSAGLVILSNEFASLYHNQEADIAIASCISILRYCAESDVQAERVVYIIETFHEANLNRPERARSVSLPGRRIPTITPASSHNNTYDPMAHFFARGSKHGVREKQQNQQQQQQQPRQPQQQQNQRPGLAPATKRERPFIPTGHHQAMSSTSSQSSISTTSMRPVLPSSSTVVYQQPSPEATVGVSPANSSNGSSSVAAAMNTATSAGMSGAMTSSAPDAMNIAESEFDFDSLYPPWNHQNTRGGAGGDDIVMSMAQHPHHVVPTTTAAESYGAYVLGGSVQDGHVPLYTSSGFR